MNALFEPKTNLTITPRPYQSEDLVESFRQWDDGIDGTLTRIFTGGGKCLGKDTPVLMFDGSIKPVQDIVIGELLMGPDSKPRTVLSTCHGFGKLYRINPNRCGDSFVVNSDHILCLKATKFSEKINTICGLKSGQYATCSVKDYLKSSKSYKHITKGYRTSINFDGDDAWIDPYFLGVWLGDGTEGKAEVTTKDKEIVDEIYNQAFLFGLEVAVVDEVNTGLAKTYRMVVRDRTNGRLVNPLVDLLRDCSNPKHIPNAFKFGNEETRLNVLAGIIDADGSLHNSGYSITQKRKRLSDDIVYIARSLGFGVTISECKKTCTNTGSVGWYWRITISGDCSKIPVRIPDKKAQPRRQKKDPLLFGFKVESIGYGDYFGFEIDGDRRFVLGDFTVTHNTITACLCFDRWLQRGDNYHCMVVSYEQELVWQFAEEIHDVMGVDVGIEMGTECISPGSVPRVVVASRQTLQNKALATGEQRAILEDEYGIDDLGLTTKSLAKSLLNSLKTGDVSPDQVRDAIAEHHEHYEVDQEVGAVSRLHKFDWRNNWLVCFDEAHKHAYHLKTVRPLIDWFARNPESRRKGLTATPKRFDGVSIGDKLFPGISIDYPLVSVTGRSALRDGYAVPYVQKYISVEGVDFKKLNKVAGDFDEGELERLLSEEKTLASLVDPLLDMVGDRRTLIFSPGVEMAKLVSAYINVRRECKCPLCGRVDWYAKSIIGDGAACECGALLDEGDITKDGEQSKTVYGTIPKQKRREIYREHKTGGYQFLSVCSLCKEGYNDREISCVAVFRPVSKKASSLAEQMKGRGSRPLPGLIEGIESVDERLDLIRNSAKPDCLIVDLVGITGLADCATTVQIYAEGADDKVIERAEELQVSGEVENTEEAVKRAKEEIEKEREAARLRREEEEKRQREEAERRAAAQADVSYTTHDVGYGSESSKSKHEATEKQINYIESLGMEFLGWEPSRRQAGRIITMLKDGIPSDEVAYKNGIPRECWEPKKATINQAKFLSSRGINSQGYTKSQASDLIGAIKAEGTEFFEEKISRCETGAQLDWVGKVVSEAIKAGSLKGSDIQTVVQIGRERRQEVTE